MATNMFLKLGDIAGECEDANHVGWIEITSWSHGFSQPTTPVRASSGATVEKANHTDLTFTKYLDKATDAILSTCWTGKQLPTAVLELYRADGDKDPVKYLKIDMEKVIVSNYTIGHGGGGDHPSENISLSYGKVTYTYLDQKKLDAQAGAAQPVSHDLIKNTVSG
jgi:type VI secretion system secreted protein Hcp